MDDQGRLSIRRRGSEQGLGPGLGLKSGSGSGSGPRSPPPQTIAHRGYKARYPENTLLAFSKAIDAGAHALETDIHMTRDGEVILSHVSLYYVYLPRYG